MFRKPLALGAVVLGLALVTACNGEAAGPGKTVAATVTAPTAAPSADANTAVATIGGETITMAQIDELAAPALLEARQAIYEARARALDQMINERLVKAEAAKRSVDEETLFRQEVEAKAPPPTDAEIEAFYNENRAMMRGELAELKPRIAQHLQQQKVADAAAAFINGLRDAAGVKILLDAPRVQVSAGNSPRWGRAGAPVEIVEFSDFQCPYCTRGAETLEQVKKHYGDKVTIVYRHFPLPMHDRADEGAAASECANEQGKFWEYHDILFANQRALQRPQLEAYAEQLGLNMAKFREALDTGKFKAQVDADLAQARSAGISGTPSFLINGQKFVGAQPYERFEEQVKAALGN